MSLHLSVAQQVPEFVRADYPVFVEFLEAYYKWYEEVYSLGKLEDLVDLDDTIEEFLQYFKKQLDIYGITAANDRTYIKHIKELYTAKGAPIGFEFLFKILYDQPSRVFEPWDSVFKPSAAKWVNPISIFVHEVVGVVDVLVNKQIIITDIDNNEYTVFVNEVIQNTSLDLNIHELFITRFEPTTTLKSFKSLDGSVTGVIL